MSHFFEKGSDTLSFCQLSCSRITAYYHNAIWYTWPKDVIFTNHIFEWQIQQTFDYSRFSVKGSQHVEKSFLKLSFQIFLMWNDQLFCFYIVKYYCKILHDVQVKGMNRSSFSQFWEHKFWEPKFNKTTSL